MKKTTKGKTKVNKMKCLFTVYISYEIMFLFRVCIAHCCTRLNERMNNGKAYVFIYFLFLGWM